MEWLLVLQIVLFAIIGSLIYLIIGIIPGTDETSVLVPATVLLFAFQLDPLVILSFFIGAMVSLNVTDSIPTALTSIPGGVMSTPMVESSTFLKERGLVTHTIRRMTSGAIYGTIIGLLVGLAVLGGVKIVEHLTSSSINEAVNGYQHWVFLAGAIFLALMSKKKLISLVAIIPFGLTVYGARLISNSISATPFFLAITTGPLLFQLVTMLIPKLRNESSVNGHKDIVIERDEKFGLREFSTSMRAKSTIPTLVSSLISSLLFFLSPVGVTMLVGETATNHIKDEEERGLTKVSVMNGVASATYMSGIIVSLFAFGFAISPAAAGPGGAFFNSDYQFLSQIKLGPAIGVIIFAMLVALFIAATLAFKYAGRITYLVFKYIPQEAVISLLIGLAFLLVYLDSGFLGVIVITGVALIAGFLNRLGVGHGILFMSFYTALYMISFGVLPL